MERHVFDRMEEIDAHHWWFVSRRHIVANLLRKEMPDRQLRVLEVGCGTGSNLPMLSRFGTVDAIEPDDQARTLAATRSGLAIMGGYLPHGVDLADNSYDLIVLLDVLEHVEEDVEALTLLRSKLAPGGKILVTVPATPWLWSAHDVAHHHKRRYTRRTLELAFAKAGFAAGHQTHFNSLLFPLVVLARIVARLRGKEGGDDTMPPRGLNWVLGKIFSSERHWVPHVNVPFGVSLAAIATPA